MMMVAAVTPPRLTAQAAHSGSPPGTIPPQHFTARPADLATVSDRYVQDTRSVSAWYSYTGTRCQAQTSFIGGPSLLGRLSATLVEYISASPPMFWQTEYSECRAG